MKLIHTLSIACTAAALMLPVSSVSYAGDSAFAAGAVGSIAYADIDYKYGKPKEETSIAAGGAIGVVATHGTGTATLKAWYSGDASTTTTTHSAPGGGMQTSSLTHGDGDSDSDGCGCRNGTTASVSGGLSLSASSSD
jgi:hypothetical protein